MADVETLSEVEQVFKDSGVSAESTKAFLTAFGGGDITHHDLATSTEANLEDVLSEAVLTYTHPNDLGEDVEADRKLTALEKSRLRRAILECTRRAGVGKPGAPAAPTSLEPTNCGHQGEDWSYP